MKASVVVPVKDGAAYLAAALSSLTGGSRPPEEIVVVDDNSEDGSAELARQLGATVLTNRGRGPASARNTGVAATTGELVGFLDADDVATPDRLRVQAGLFEADRRLEVAAGLARDVLDPAESSTSPALRTFTAGTLLVRRTTWERVGDLDETLVAGEIVDWVARARRLDVRWALHDDVVLLRRLHDANHSGSERARAGYLDLARSAIRRNRDRP
jgi:glycosyltransferase involved in cell wall biosynthesis